MIFTESLRKFFSRCIGGPVPQWGETPVLPDGYRLYAVGDIHGRADLLAALQDRIERDGGSFAGEKVLVYLGDYIDRGMDSRQVLDLLIQQPLVGYRRIFLRGNHEQTLLDFVTEPAILGLWLEYGGRATLASYGVLVEQRPDPKSLAKIRDRFLELFPAPHLAFIRNTAPSFECGDYFFVHAGIRPGRPLGKQQQDDLLWIREPFTDSPVRHEKFIVHGHTIARGVDIQPNRIGIDTGAYATGSLTCLVLEGREQRFLATGDR